MNRNTAIGLAVLGLAVGLGAVYGPGFLTDLAVQKGLAASAKGKYEDAIEAYTSAIRYGGDREDYRFRRGTAYLLSGHTDEALSDFDAGLALNPRRALKNLIRKLRSAAILRQGKSGKFFGECAAYLKDNPVDRDIRLVRGIHLLQRGEPKVALFDLESAVSFDQDTAYIAPDENAGFLLAGIKAPFGEKALVTSRFYRALAYQRAGETTKAEEDIRYIKEHDKLLGSLAEARGLVEDLRKTVGAEVPMNLQPMTAEEKAALAEGFLALAEQYTTNHRKIGDGVEYDSKEALADADRAVMLVPKMAKAYRVRARLLAFDVPYPLPRSLELAIEDIKKALELSPDPETAAELKRLNRFYLNIKNLK